MQSLAVQVVVFTSPSVSPRLTVSEIMKLIYCLAAGNDNKDASNESPARVASANTVGA